MKKFFLYLLLHTTYATFGQDFKESILPILIISTNGKEIVDEPKIQANLKIIDNENGKTNSINDLLSIYDGYIGIEFRGSSSQIWPKKPYGFELQDAKGESIKKSIFGFPSESDFTLLASYNEKSLMHVNLAFHLARGLFPYASRTKYVEVVINKKYMGVYLVMEKLKRDNNRVNISKLEEKDIAGDALTGGYIIKVDKETGTNSGGWYSKIKPVGGNSNSRVYYQYEYPKVYTQQQKTYIEEYVHAAETAINSSNFADPITGYKKYIEPNSFAKMLILNEVSKNIDGYRISTFLYKDKDSKGGKLTAGPPWDYDFTFGMPDYCDAWTHQNFMYEIFNKICSGDYWLVPFYWQRLMTDQAFQVIVKREYTLQRLKGILRDSELQNHVDSVKTLLTEAQKRNFQKWNVLGKYDWPNKTTPATWEGEVAEIMPWLKNRLNWLDFYWLEPKLIGIISSSETESLNFDFKITPNPVVNDIILEIQSANYQEVNLKIIDQLGKEVFTTTISLNEGKTTFEVKQKFNRNAVYFVFLQTKNGHLTKKMITL
jgi:CotH kinase protein/Secretion system C-terminal sorting domain